MTLSIEPGARQSLAGSLYIVLQRKNNCEKKLSIMLNRFLNKSDLKQEVRTEER
jgi:hypothetical protein